MWPEQDEPEQPSRVHIHIPLKLIVVLLLLLLLIGGGYALVNYVLTPKRQADWLHQYGQELTYQLQSGASSQVVHPSYGPFDQRLGYSQLPQLSQLLAEQGFAISAQAVFSPQLMAYTQKGFYPPYREKSQAGLDMLDCRAQPLYQFRYPKFQYQNFNDIPPLVTNALLFIEHRELLDEWDLYQNPAINWPRFAKALLTQAGKAVSLDLPGAGGSTLATQIEKYRHSYKGRTNDYRDKLVQMVSASVRAFQASPQSLAARQQIMLDYLNTVPLAAAPGHGEVNGMMDGMQAWFGVDPYQVNALLLDAPNQPVAQVAAAMRQVLALMIAHRRPSYYLFAGRNDLEDLIDSYLRLLAQEGIINPPLLVAALKQRTVFRDFSQTPITNSVAADKTVSVLRTQLGALLKHSLYDLDRLDLQAQSTINGQLQLQASQYLQGLADESAAAQAQLYGQYLLSPGQAAGVEYSFTLFEQTPQGAQVRIQTDTSDSLFDINQSSKLELGSTAKVRVLTTYLEIIAELYQRYQPLTPAELKAQPIAKANKLGLWVREQLLAQPQLTLQVLLQNAMERRYSANPNQAFFTGGGLHRFNNFNRADDSKLPTLSEALQFSYNLPFVRLLQDIVNYTIYQHPDRQVMLTNDDDPQREQYLARFADREGRTYLQRFWQKYRNLEQDDRADVFLASVALQPDRIASVYRYLWPEQDSNAFNQFMRAQFAGRSFTDSQLYVWFNKYAPGKFSLVDQAYIARVHPLELWLVKHLLLNPQADLTHIIEHSAAERQQVYTWLFKTRHRSARDSRIRTMLEVEAFADIHLRWQRLGYPFPHLVPSLATALGSSGDQPAALAELLGTIANNGVRLPARRIGGLMFGAQTPYETHFVRSSGQPVQLLAPEIAQTLQQALRNVVELGTARRINGQFVMDDGSRWVVGGKTGTGDNRIERYSRSGQLISSSARNRTATFVFYLGERYFGTITAYVLGQEAQQYSFTSGLPVQVLKSMVPMLNPYLNQPSLCAAEQNMPSNLAD